MAEFCQGDNHLGIGVLTEVLYLDITGLVVNHIGRGNTADGNVAACHFEGFHLFLAKSENSNFYLRVFWSFQPVHGFFVGHLFANEFLAVDFHNLVACKQSSALGRTILDDALDVDGIFTNHKLDANSRERTLQVVSRYLCVFG